VVTYDLSSTEMPLYQQLYECIKADISSGKLKINEKMPSKRTLADNLGVSTITVENAYGQLIGEGYMYALPKRGYYISDISDLCVTDAPIKKNLKIEKRRESEDYRYDFSSNKTESDDFPFSAWAKLMRDAISLREKELLTVSPCEGVEELREAIAKHLRSFRGMNVDPDQIVVGAGTEYLYSLLIKLLGTDKVYCVENPGYKKLQSIYESNDVACRYVNLDDYGMNVDALRACGSLCRSAADMSCWHGAMKKAVDIS
jgi:GntR family transcriptional regulator/MocR family aminotransferase